MKQTDLSQEKTKNTKNKSWFPGTRGRRPSEKSSNDHA
jgi:hypothetical protein